MCIYGNITMKFSVQLLKKKSDWMNALQASNNGPLCRVELRGRNKNDTKGKPTLRAAYL
jgi:hypothetical protein